MVTWLVSGGWFSSSCQRRFSISGRPDGFGKWKLKEFTCQKSEMMWCFEVAHTGLWVSRLKFLPGFSVFLQLWNIINSFAVGFMPGVSLSWWILFTLWSKNTEASLSTSVNRYVCIQSIPGYKSYVSEDDFLQPSEKRFAFAKAKWEFYGDKNIQWQTCVPDHSSAFYFQDTPVISYVFKHCLSKLNEGISTRSGATWRLASYPWEYLNLLYHTTCIKLPSRRVSMEI